VTALDDENVNSDLSLFKSYPNPVSDILVLDFGKQLSRDYIWEVIDHRGVTIAEGTIPRGTERTEIEAGKLPNGLHILLLGTTDGLEIHRKITVIH
jgi:hypothetical protein